jgi:hypothetical protein
MLRLATKYKKFVLQQAIKNTGQNSLVVAPFVAPLIAGNDTPNVALNVAPFTGGK